MKNYHVDINRPLRPDYGLGSSDWNYDESGILFYGLEYSIFKDSDEYSNNADNFLVNPHLIYQLL